MKEIIQLNLTEKESIILQAIIYVGITLRTKDATKSEEVLENLKKKSR